MGLIWPRMQCLYLRLKPRLGAGLPSLLGLRLISKMASFHHPRRARLPLWFAGKRIQPKPKGFLVLTHSHTSLLYAKWTCWKRNHWKASSWGFFFGGGSLEGLPFTWPGKPLPSAQEAYSPFAGYPNSVAVTHESDECWTREHTFVNRAECHGNKISILMKKKIPGCLFMVISLLGVVSVLLKMKSIKIELSTFTSILLGPAKPVKMEICPLAKQPEQLPPSSDWLFG